ncbi:MAG: sodium/glutamate symporter, partial [Bacteroidales bacterium]|nr:sodium/glutamate symporter [Bacteroidales bacterium]
MIEELLLQWEIVIYLMLIGIFMFIAKILKTKVPFLNKVVIPTSLLGGFLGLLTSLIFSPLLFGTETFFDGQIMDTIVYHALAIGFIALALKREPAKLNKKIWSTGMLITSTYALQAVIGILLVFTLFSDKFIGSGMLVALGFGQGPGLALSIGNTWNDQLLGFGGTLGVAYAFLGFVFGGTVGVVLINLISRRTGKLKPNHYDEGSVAKQSIEIDTIREISILDGLTTQLVIISIIYGAVAATLFGSYYLLQLLPGEVGNQIFGLLKGFNFIIGILYAVLY